MLGVGKCILEDDGDAQHQKPICQREEETGYEDADHIWGVV